MIGMGLWMYIKVFWGKVKSNDLNSSSRILIMQIYNPLCYAMPSRLGRRGFSLYTIRYIIHHVESPLVDSYSVRLCAPLNARFPCNPFPKFRQTSPPPTPKSLYPEQ
jgi:hypothetical protein